MPYRHGGLRRRQSADHPLLREISVRAYVDQVSDRDSWKLTAATITGKGGMRDRSETFVPRSPPGPKETRQSESGHRVSREPPSQIFSNHPKIWLIHYNLSRHSALVERAVCLQLRANSAIKQKINLI